MTMRILAVAFLLAAMVAYCDCCSWLCGGSTKSRVEQAARP